MDDKERVIIECIKLTDIPRVMVNINYDIFKNCEFVLVDSKDADNRGG